MGIVLRGLVMVMVSAAVSACSMSDSSMMGGNSGSGDASMGNANVTRVASGAPLAGNLTAAMDENDKDKLSRALDAALGKSSTWKNPINNITYTVTPIAKKNMGEGKICRSYSVRADRSGQVQEIQGDACVGDNGAWQVMG